MGSPHWSEVARPATSVSEWRDLLATSALLGGERNVASGVAGAHRHARRTTACRLGGDLRRRDLHGREKRGDAVGLTKRGKGSKCLVLVSGEGIPLGVAVAAASKGETSLVEPALEEVIQLAGDETDTWPKRIIGDKAYDSDSLRKMLAEVDIELLAPHRRNRKRGRVNDGRKMRRYRRRWKVERFFAWAGAFRRFLVRHERLEVMYRAVVHAVCLMITLRYL
jgi:transposase